MQVTSLPENVLSVGLISILYLTDPVTVALARLISQFGLILRGETFDCAHSALVRATEKTKTVLDQKTEVE